MQARWHLVLGAFALLGLGLGLGAMAVLPGAKAPSFAAVQKATPSSEAVLLDRNGQVLHATRVDFRKRRLSWTGYDEVAPIFWRVLQSAEDKRFFRHHGVDIRALGHGAWQSLWGRRRGGSTITMQLARLLPGAPRSGGIVKRKLQAMRMALALERHWSKQQILEAYANLVTVRGEVQGLAAASWFLLGKAPTGLDEAEAAVLVASLRAPNAPWPEVARRARLLAVGTPAAELAALARRLAQPQGQAMEPALAPHVAARLLGPGARLVRTTLSASLQRKVQAVVQNELSALMERHVQDAAVVVLDNQSGDVLAYVGGVRGFSGAFYLDAAASPRQPGSALKPFLYGAAIAKRRLTAASLLEDSAVQLTTPSGLYVPQDYDRQFRGLVSARLALAGSLNVPAVRVLMLLGVDAFITQLRQLGLSTIIRDGEYYGYALALGSAPVNLLQLANAYRALANGGLWSAVRWRPDEPKAAAVRVLDAGAAFIVADILADNGSRAVTFGTDSVLALPFWAAVKTGTSKDMRDNWCLGFSKDVTVGVWVGNLDNTPMHDVSGITGAAPIWAAVLRLAQDAAMATPPRPPAGVQATLVHWPDGAEPPRREWFLTGTEMAQVRRVPAAVRPRILAPASGSILALDPDIPHNLQQVVLASNLAEEESGQVGAAGHLLRWELDGKPLGTGPWMAWQPRPGRHVVRLLGPHGAALDQARFVVKGE